MFLMYDSPKEPLQKILPMPLVEYRQVALVAAALYILGSVLPFLSRHIHYAIYDPMLADSREVVTPADPIQAAFAGFGTIGGPAQVASEQSGSEMAAGLIFEILITPVAIIALPILGMVVAFGPVLIGWCLLVGYKRSIPRMMGVFIVLSVFYFLLLILKGVTVEPHVGFVMILLGTILLFGITFDRATIFDLVENNGYRTPSTAYTTRLLAGEAWPRNRNSNEEDEEHNDDDTVVYTGSVERPKSS